MHGLYTNISVSKGLSVVKTPRRLHLHCPMVQVQAQYVEL